MFKCGSVLHKNCQTFVTHILAHPDTYTMPKIRQQLWFPVAHQMLVSDERIQSKWPTFEQDLIENPSDTLNCIGLAMHQCLQEWHAIQISQASTSSADGNMHLKLIVARLFGCGPVVNLRSVKLANFGRLVCVHGTIIRVSQSEILCSWMAFQCRTCLAEQTLKLIDGIMAMPMSCRSSGCRARSHFEPLLLSPYTRTESFQTMRLQESMKGTQFDSGRVPRAMEVELSRDLVDSVCPGDDVTVVGILKVRPSDEMQFQRKTPQPSLYRMYLEAVSVASNKNDQSSRKNELTARDMRAIDMIKSEPCPFRLFVHSLCPSIYGHEMVKAGLILGLLGGAASTSDIEAGRRTEAHILMVGDPGVGKSKLLQACSSVSPRGVFVCGNSSTKAGLTVTVGHGKGTGGALEAGALVLADQGACCIDEFDKMSANYHALLEVMESQTVSIAKAGVLCTLPARTCILAAANPAGGHYTKSKTVSENLKMNPALLSRFDLVFIMQDRTDAHLDSLLTAHIQALHNEPDHADGSMGRGRGRNCTVASNDNRLIDTLKLATGEKIDAVPHVLMQKYIGFARKNIHPTLSSEADEALKCFYLQLRQVNVGVESIPVTTRQLEALVRLTQARARCELAQVATLQHAQDVLQISKHSMADVLSTDMGTLQMERNMNGIGMSQTKQIQKYLQLLQARRVAKDKTVFAVDELKAIAVAGGLQTGFENMIDSLNVQGILLKKGHHLYKFITD